MSVAFEYLLRYPNGDKLTLADPDEVDRRLDEFSTSGADGWLEVSAKVIRPARTKRASAPSVVAAQLRRQGAFPDA